LYCFASTSSESSSARLKSCVVRKWRMVMAVDGFAVRKAESPARWLGFHKSMQMTKPTQRICRGSVGARARSCRRPCGRWSGLLRRGRRVVMRGRIGPWARAGRNAFGPMGRREPEDGRRRSAISDAGNADGTPEACRRRAKASLRVFRLPFSLLRRRHRNPHPQGDQPGL
jgi:hypothetical protein